MTLFHRSTYLHVCSCERAGSIGTVRLLTDGSDLDRSGLISRLLTGWQSVCRQRIIRLPENVVGQLTASATVQSGWEFSNFPVADCVDRQLPGISFQQTHLSVFQQTEDPLIDKRIAEKTTSLPQSMIMCRALSELWTARGAAEVVADGAVAIPCRGRMTGRIRTDVLLPFGSH